MTTVPVQPEEALIGEVVAAADRLVAGSIRAHAAAALVESEARRERKRALDADAARHRDTIGGARRRLDAEHDVLRRELEAWRRQLGPAAADWEHAFWRDRGWKPLQAPAFLRFGELSLDRDRDDLRAPALVRFPADGGILFRAPQGMRAAALGAAQSVALRALAAAPSGHVRLVLLDPVGMGESVATFMYLADARKELVTGRAWVERQEIERQLEDVSRHMQMVIQTYLRGSHATLEDYNRSAATIAEPSLVVVAADFPTGYSEEAVRRLSSIARMGRRCGVFLVVTADSDRPIPGGVEADDFARELVVVDGDAGEFHWSPPGPAPRRRERVSLDAPPPPAVFRAIVESVGDDARVAPPIEVPLERVLPAQWWTESSADGVDAPIGMFGDGARLSFTVGRGTAQHALVVGRAGSGRSTLLHALVLSLAARYSPEELRLYLLDFGKGGDFAPYANPAHVLPHARVVATHCERELGLSVLRALDEELSRRTCLFREAGVRQVDALRALGHELPRTLLLVDDFHAMFDPPDVVAREIGELLDRLVHQGGRVGMHVVLGAHGISGRLIPYREQLTVRIALQCGADDAAVVLGRDGAMTRLLERPGDALHRVLGAREDEIRRFHACWTDDRDRARLLTALAERAAGLARLPRPIVFAGDEVARLDDDPDHPLLKVAPARTPAPIRLWLGAPVSIDPPIAVELSRSPGRNLLIVARDGAAASGMIGSCLLALARQVEPGAGRVVCFDFTPADADGAAVPTPARVLDILPEGIVERGAPSELGGRLRDLAQLVADRQQEVDGAAPVLLVLHGVQRARVLRRDDGAGAAGELLATILRDGPAVGVHVIAWVDSVQALQYVVDPRMLSEFGCRVAMAMSDAHSQALIGCPDAAQLGARRALLWNDESLGALTRFRPYALPAARWMREQTAARAAGDAETTTGRSPWA